MSIKFDLTEFEGPEGEYINQLRSVIADLKAQALKDAARVVELEAKLKTEIENRKGWQDRAADAEAKIYRSETPYQGDS